MGQRRSQALTIGPMDMEVQFHQMVARMVMMHEQQVRGLKTQIDHLTASGGRPMQNVDGRITTAAAGSTPLGGAPRSGHRRPSLTSSHHNIHNNANRQARRKSVTQQEGFQDMQASVSLALQERRQERNRNATASRDTNGSADSTAASRDTAGGTVKKKEAETRVIANIKLDKTARTNLEAFFHGPFEVIISVLIFLNAVSVFIGYQYAGMDRGVQIGAVDATEVWAGHKDFFWYVDHAFQLIFIFDLLVRLCYFRSDFFHDRVMKKLDNFNIFDVIIVLVGCLEMYLFPMLDLGIMKLGFFRIIRLARLARTLKELSLLKRFAKLRVLLSTVAASVMALSSSMLFLFFFMYLAACFVTQQLQAYLLDVSDPNLRLELWNQYGTSTKALWTLFEMTLGSQGTNPTRQLVGVHWSFCLFVTLYIGGVVFAVICIIQALFLKDTLEVAANDAEAMVNEGLERRSDTIRKLEQVFYAADTDGDAGLSLEEFEDVISIPQVKGYLEVLELDFTEAKHLFELLNDGDDSMDYNEFVEGIMRLKGQASAMDMIAVMRDMKKLLEYMEEFDAKLVNL